MAMQQVIRSGQVRAAHEKNVTRKEGELINAQKKVEEAIASLPAAPPAAAWSGLNGRWKLEWSSQTADVNPFATPASVLGGECIQARNYLIALAPRST